MGRKGMERNGMGWDGMRWFRTRCKVPRGKKHIMKVIWSFVAATQLPYNEALDYTGRARPQVVRVGTSEAFCGAYLAVHRDAWSTALVMLAEPPAAKSVTARALSL
eukprot:scaffold103521_cov47-Prasinocladus_malaysianus.AAC.2